MSDHRTYSTPTKAAPAAPCKRISLQWATCATCGSKTRAFANTVPECFDCGTAKELQHKDFESALERILTKTDEELAKAIDEASSFDTRPSACPSYQAGEPPGIHPTRAA